MLFTALRDMQWRRWRFVIAIVVTGLVFAMTLVLTGLANGALFRNLDAGIYDVGRLSPRHESGVWYFQSLVRESLARAA